MKITLNGKTETAEPSDTVSSLLTRIGMGGRPVVVELNREALLPREHSQRTLAEGDIIEVVQITAGG